MFKIKLTIISTLLVLLISSCQTLHFNEGKMFIWQDNDCLKWNKFSHVFSNEKDSNAAVSYVGIFTQSAETENIVVIKIMALFNISKSWVMINYKNSNTLNHEQMHFNITEVYSRIFRKAIIDTLNLDRSFSKYKLEQLSPLMLKRFSQMETTEQKRYDNETDHGWKREKQLDFNERILKQLESLMCYKATEITIEFLPNKGINIAYPTCLHHSGL